MLKYMNRDDCCPNKTVAILSGACIENAPRHSLQGRHGEIRHLFRSFAFLHSRMMTENAGIFVCRTRHLVLAGGSKVNCMLARVPRCP